MSRLPQIVRLAHCSLPRRVAISRPPAMIRGYPTHNKIDDSDSNVFLFMKLKAKSQTHKEEKFKELLYDDKAIHIMEHAPGWNELLASESEALVSSHISVAKFLDQS